MRNRVISWLAVILNAVHKAWCGSSQLKLEHLSQVKSQHLRRQQGSQVCAAGSQARWQLLQVQFVKLDGAII